MRHLISSRNWFGVLLSMIVAAQTCTSAMGQQRSTEHALFQAIRRGDADMLAGLLRSGAPADIRDDAGTTPLMYAALHGNAKMLDLLLRHGADPNAANKRGVTALIWGASDSAKVELLLDRGADPTAATELGNTPLMVASGSPTGSPAVEALLAHGAKLNRKNKRGRTALRVAAEGGDVHTVQLLLAEARRQKDLEQVVRDAGTAVAEAAENGFDEIVEMLLAHGANPNRSTGSRGHALNAALMAGQSEIAKTLIDHKAGFDKRSQPGDTPIVLLAAYTETGDASIVKLLQQHGADFSATNEDQHTALTWARMRGHGSLIDLLEKAKVPEGEMPERPEIPYRSVDLNSENQARLITKAVQKSVNLLQRSSDTFLDVRKNCVSCHQQNLPGVAIAWARDRGFHTQKPTMDRIIDRQVKSWEPRIERSYELDSPYPVPPRFLGWGMWTFAELGYRPDELTRSVSWYLAATQQRDGRWVPGMLRPPVGGNEILATLLAMRSLQLYPLEGREREMKRRVRRARRWLRQAEPQTHQDMVCRMLGLASAGIEPDGLTVEVRQLLELQREDGGWAQLSGLESDAWATGQSLVALHTAGGIPTDDSAYRRGIEFLLRTQFDDGSWFVQSRSWPFQPYFESDFPFGRDQWVSAPATAWAVMGLVLAVDQEDVVRLNDSQFAESTETGQRHAEPDNTPVELVAAATRKVDFVKDIKPLLDRSCVGCHGAKDAESNFSVTSRDAIIQGGDSELNAVLPGASHDSPLVRFSAGVVKEMEMPPLKARKKYPPLTSNEIALLRAWVDQGAMWSAEK